jgi:cytochrome c oxidase subunit 1
MSASAIALLIFQIPFIWNFFYNAFAAAMGRTNVGSNPWEATTLEWAATTSPPLHHGNFETLPIVCRGPYEYNTPEAIGTDYLPQHVAVEKPAPVVAPPTAPVAA